MKCYQTTSCHQSHAQFDVYCIFKGHSLHKLISIYPQKYLLLILYNGVPVLTRKEKVKWKKRRNQLREAAKQSLYLTSSVWEAEVKAQETSQPELCQIAFYIRLRGSSDGGIPISTITKHHLTATFINNDSINKNVFRTAATKLCSNYHRRFNVNNNS